jgi:DNA-binding MarR family transcriptional regulator
MEEEASLYTTLKEIYFSIDNGDRLLLDGFNLSVPRYYLLKHIAENPGITLTQLSSLMLTDKSNITRLIKSVEMEGLVCKQKHLTDGRAISLYLTETGGDLVSEAVSAHESFTSERFSPIHEQVNGILNELVEIKLMLENHLDKSSGPSWSSGRDGQTSTKEDVI